VKKRHVTDAFSGEGPRLGGGRWNYIGTRVVYVSSTLALAAWELFVHFTEKDIVISRSLYSITAEIPDNLKIEEVSAGGLKSWWDSSPPPDFTKEIGEKWLAKGSSAVLKVPSAIIPTECNFVLNPDHPDFSRIAVRRPVPFMIDDRAWKHRKKT